jgi:integrase
MPGVVPQAAVVTLAARPGQVFKTHKNSVAFRILKNGSTTCAVKHLYAWWRFRGSPAQGEVPPLSTMAARKELQKAAAMVTKLPRSAFGLHSLRPGGATHMETTGKPMSEIMALGRWKSSAVLLHLRGGEKVAVEMGRRVAMSDERQAL